MKTLLGTLFLVIMLALPCSADEIQNEAVDSLSTAQKFVTDGNYSKAIEEINYALAKINELTAAQLLSFIPDPPDGYILINKNSQGSGAGASIMGTAGATAEYSSESGAKIDLNIAIGGVSGKMASLAAFGSMFAGLAQDAGAGQTRQIRVQGYTGTEMFNAQTGEGTLTFQIGQKTSITFKGTSIESVDVLKGLAQNFDFAGIEKSF